MGNQPEAPLPLPVTAVRIEICVHIYRVSLLRCLQLCARQAPQRGPLRGINS